MRKTHQASLFSLLFLPSLLFAQQPISNLAQNSEIGITVIQLGNEKFTISKPTPLFRYQVNEGYFSSIKSSTSVQLSYEHFRFLRAKASETFL